MSAPTRASTAGRAYLDLRKLARKNHRPAAFHHTAKPSAPIASTVVAR